MDDRPNVQVIFTSKPSPGPSFGAVVLELITFLGIAFGLALLAGGGCMWLWW